MKIVLCSDPHADKKTAGLDRYADVARAMEETVDHAVRVKADLWACLGDLADPDDGPDALRAAELAIRCSQRLAYQKISSLWVMGNHDVIEDGSGRSTLSPLRARHSQWVSVCETPALRFFGDEGDGVCVLALPYSPVTRPYDLAAYAREEIAKISPGARLVVLAHATHIAGAREGEETLEMPRGRAVSLPVEEFPLGAVVCNGHFHTPQVTPSGVIIPGALARLTFGEERNTPRFLELEV
jgi:DNA repair exonuclease SbcCD nuclease subunit